MADGYSDRLSMPLLHAGQAQKEIFHNEALAVIDMLVQASVETAPLSSPPDTPVAGQCWLVGPGGSGDWAGQDGALACWTTGGWRFSSPFSGMRVWVRDAGHGMMHDGADWQDEPVRADGIYVAGERVVGTRQPAIADPVDGSVVDSESRAAITTILAMLRTHGLTA